MLDLLNWLEMLAATDAAGWEVGQAVIVAAWIVMTTVTAWWAVHSPSGW